MTSPTNSGIVVIKNAGDGTKTVMVTAGVQNGQPMEVFAVHSRRTSVVVDPGVNLIQDGATSYTEKMALAFADESGVVHVRAPRADGGLLMNKKLFPSAPA
jgi:hypothetical protein